MPKAERVKVHKVDSRGNRIRERRTFAGITGLINKVKLGIAISLDVIDFFIAWIPVLNTVWDIVTMLILMVILNNKALAFLQFIEFPFIGIPPFSAIDSFIPIATIAVLLDITGK